MVSETAYFPPPESRGGWRTATAPQAVRELAGMDASALERAWEVVAGLHADSALLVVRHGWLCFERYQGAVTALSNPDLHSCGKAFTATAAGIVVEARPDLFPHRLEQLVYDEPYLPPQHRPVRDARRRAIRLGHLLSHTSGLRGNNGATFDARGPLTLSPAGPDGGFPDHVAFGHDSWVHQGQETTTATLWCDPGAGYSYASAGTLIVGAMVRHLSGQEVADFLSQRVFEPIGWEGWRWDSNPPEPDGTRHTKAQGGIRPRPRDALRFGYLHLHEGRWAGRQLVPSWYAAAMRRPAAHNPYYPHYGLQVRLNVRAPAPVEGATGEGVNAGRAAPRAPGDAYGPAGFADNYIYVVPSLDLVAVRLGRRTEAHLRQPAWHTVLEAVVAAVVD